MKTVNSPMTIVNTDTGDWIVQLDDFAASTSGERVSITVAIRRDPYATLPDVRRRAVQRAIELLQAGLDNAPS